ncbi:hypothetical protein F5876DRAFT_82850 [Lentinula aff. lateritia]|uniref:Uncharacterized protein n=1 Tax=Lentinula aff. lateritia TaxID=2804960 RepID=A0ACC1TJ64_9AGAR|nr:hypothetical protein F5876DRAFT_82850 [Lentinula aff. lateritia]
MSTTGSLFTDPEDSDDELTNKINIMSLIAKFDIARSTLLGGRSANTPFLELDRKAVEKYIDLVLSGTGEDGQYTLHIPTAFHHVLDDPEVSVMRDIDSALIFREHFPWTTSYDIFTTYENKKSVHGHLHAQVRFLDNEGTGDHEYRDPGNDPNVLWGVCGRNGGRNRIYLMLPGATDEDMTDLHPLIYEATLNAAKLLNEEVTTTWSPTYAAEMDRTARFSRTRFRTESRKSISSETGRAFADEVMDSIRTYPWGANSYWFIQIRGAKDLTRDYSELTQGQMDIILEHVDQHLSVIFVDVGLEIHLPGGYAAMPDRTQDGHANLAEALWGIDSETEWDYYKYEPDSWAGVADIAGFRCNFASEPRTTNRISYIQVYTSDKFQTYNTSGEYGAALQVFGPSVLKMSHPDEIPPSISKVYQASESNLRENTPTATRCEARVPLHLAFQLDSIQVEIADLAPFLHVLPSKAIW